MSSNTEERAAIPFNKPHLTGRELEYIRQAHARGQLAGDGEFTKRCEAWLEEKVGSAKALLTHSCTAALEMAAILLDLGDGDEVIMPSYTFVSTANAFVLRGAVPVFVDIRADTLNLDEDLVERAITPNTRAIVAVHYGGVGCDLPRLRDIADRYGLALIEDAAQGLMATYNDRPLGSWGDLAALSFHETKNLIAGEGGALLVNSERLVRRAEIIREKGTNRSQFFRGEVDKYTWVDIGSSYLPGEIIAAFLFAQLEGAAEITTARLDSWRRYHEAVAPLESRELLRRPIVPAACGHNGHLYYIIVGSAKQRDGLLHRLKDEGIGAVFHYVPLHSSPFGETAGKTPMAMPNTDTLSARLIRLPLFYGVDTDRVIDVLREAVETVAHETSKDVA